MSKVFEVETLLDDTSTPSRTSCDVLPDETKSAATETGESHGNVFDRHDQLRQHFAALFKRFLATCLAVILLVACLSAFSRLGPLDKWQQRGFNALAILFTGIMSLGLGSLLGYLGSMLRWPLLASATYKTKDVREFPSNKLRAAFL